MILADIDGGSNNLNNYGASSVWLEFNNNADDLRPKYKI